MAEFDITSRERDGMGPHGTQVGLLRVLGPAHVWALGVGIVLQPTFLAHELLRSRKLVRVLEEWTVDPLTIYAVYPDRQYLPPKVRTLIDFLVARFGARPYWDQGLP